MRLSQIVLLALNLVLTQNVSAAETRAQASRIAMGVAAVKIPSSDFDRSRAFYARYANFKDGVEYNKFERSMLPSVGDGIGVVLYKTGQSNEMDPPGRAYFIIMVPDVAAVAKRMTDDKLQNVGPLNRGQAVSLFLARDPDGNIVEFMQQN
jgi:catechol 2,3-dioxygenase-like lactoylglutathione lyase family enzyme